MVRRINGIHGESMGALYIAGRFKMYYSQIRSQRKTSAASSGRRLPHDLHYDQRRRPDYSNCSPHISLNGAGAGLSLR
jgi:hypothetical protein